MSSPERLIEGFARFRERHFAADDALFRELVEQGQAPRIMGRTRCRRDPGK